MATFVQQPVSGRGEPSQIRDPKQRQRGSFVTPTCAPTKGGSAATRLPHNNTQKSVQAEQINNTTTTSFTQVGSIVRITCKHTE